MAHKSRGAECDAKVKANPFHRHIPDDRELPCDSDDCGGESFLTADCGEQCQFTCNECGKSEWVDYGW